MHPRGPTSPRRARHDRRRHHELGDNELTKLRRSHIGFIFQFFNLLPMLTAEENILLPLELAGPRLTSGGRRPHRRVGLRPPQASALGALGRPAAARRNRARPHLQARPWSSRTSRPATSTRRTSQEILDLLRESVEEPRPDVRHGLARPEGDRHSDRDAVPRRRLVSSRSSARSSVA